MPRETPPPPADGIYRTILVVLVCTIVAGAVLAIAGDTVLRNPALSQVGTGAALIGAALYVFFRILGARETRRRARDRDRGADE